MDHSPPDGNGIYSSGAAGGGMVLIRSDKVSGTGTITANGNRATYDAGRDGGGGGGAGGSVAIAIRSGSLANLTVTANGGGGGNAWPSRTAGGTPGERHGPGGGGGGGAILTSGPILSATANGGAHGITTTLNDAYGSTDGSAGCSLDTYLLPNVPGTSSDGECRATTEVDLTDFAATRYDNGVLLHWRTGREVGNLGFNLYRSDGGPQIRVNARLVAGSMLQTAASLKAGYSYGWWDPTGTDRSLYWIEDVDRTGNGKVYGPFGAAYANGLGPVNAKSPTLGLKQDTPELTKPVWPGATDTALPIGASSNKTNGGPKGGPGGSGGPSGSPQAVQYALAGRQALKLSVREIGWYRVTAEDIASFGIDVSRIDPRTIQLFADGQQVPIYVAGEQDGRFDPGDAVEFYGTGVNIATTDTRVYWLIAGAGVGARIRTAIPHNVQPSLDSFPATVELRQRVSHFAGLSNGDKDNFFGEVVAFEPLDQNLDLTRVVPTASQASLEVALQGVTFVPHTVSVALNGTPVGTVELTEREWKSATLGVPQSLLHDGQNTVTLTPTGGDSDVSVVDYIRITYARATIADGPSLLVNIATRRPSLTIGGFTDSRVRVVDVTNAAAVQELPGSVVAGATGYEVTVQPTQFAASRLIAFQPDGAKRPASIALNVPSAWNASSQAADVVYVVYRDFALGDRSARRSAAEPGIQNRRRRRRGHLRRVRLRLPLTVCDPCVRRPGQDGVVGTSSVRGPGRRCDLRSARLLRSGSPRLRPTKMVDTANLETASDDWYADLNGDDVPDLAVGRLPVTSAAATDSLVAKIIGYESTAHTPQDALLVGDLSDVYDFTGAVLRAEAAIPPTVSTTTMFRGVTDDATTRQNLLSALSSGPMVVGYSGHGSIDTWRGGLLTSGDADSLGNSGRLSLYVVGNCLNGYFLDPTLPSLGEALLEAPNGGAIAVWASSGVTSPDTQDAMTQEYYRTLFGGTGMTTGEAVARAKASIRGDVRRTWVFLGDPMVRVR